MSNEMVTLQEKMDLLRKNPNVFDIIKRHSGVKDLTNLKSLESQNLSRLKRYVEYYHGIVTCTA
ncbi:MAG: hypothetical protein HQL70_07385 [Magnetococcales bacterium]|nr:hypothetical protein [Magnetococcales bacterium]